MKQYRPGTESLKDRLSIILIEETNSVDTDNIQMFIERTVDRLLEVIEDEVRFRRGR